MASVKDSNTSKTAHVMNLLSRNRGAAPAAQWDAPPPDMAPTPEQAPAVQPPPIITSLESDMAVSTQIKDALEASLEHTEDSQAEAEESQTEGSSASITEEASDVLEPVLTDIPAVTLVPASDSPEPEKTKANGLSCVNIMQLLVERGVDKYMALFGLCCCDQCRKDVMALALNDLPPKYVVMPQSEISPRLTVYEGRFNTAVTAQTLRACKEVLEHPRHDEAS